MCQAERYFYKEAEERGMSPEELENEWIYECGAGYIGYAHGFIFPDGSVIEIGIYEDHRVIPIDEWNRLHLVTYTITNGEADFRVNGGITWAQAEKMADMVIAEGVRQIFIDVYDCRGRYKGAIEFDYMPVSPSAIIDRIRDILY